MQQSYMRDSAIIDSSENGVWQDFPLYHVLSPWSESILSDAIPRG